MDCRLRIFYSFPHQAPAKTGYGTLMNQGVICEEGTPEELFGDPQKQETKNFLSRFRNNEQILPDSDWNPAVFQVPLLLFIQRRFLRFPAECSTG